MRIKYNKQTLSMLVRKNIRKYRLMKNYTMQELVDKANFTHQYVRDLESLGIDKTPTLGALGNFAMVLEKGMRQLFDDIADDN